MSGVRFRGGRAARVRRGAALVAVLLTVVACGSSADGRDRVPDSPTSAPPASPSAERSSSVLDAVATAAAPASAEPSPLVVMPDSDAIPRSLAYGGLVWTVTDAVITNQDPTTYIAGTTSRPTAATSLIVDLEIRNDSPHIAYVTTTSRLVAELADGSIVPGNDLERPSAAPQSTVESRFAFEVPAATVVDDVILRFEDPGREPSFDLRLAGPAPEPETGTTTQVDRSMAIPLPGIEMSWAVDSAVVARDWPLPIGFKGGTRVD